MDVTLDNWCVVHQGYRGKDDPGWPRCCRHSEAANRPCVLVERDLYQRMKDAPIIARVVR